MWTRRPILVRPLGKYYWRIDWRGLENVPAEGAALLVANHAGSIPVDALVMKFGLYSEHPAHRHVRLLAADLALRLPFSGPIARKMGNTLAVPDDAVLRPCVPSEYIAASRQRFAGEYCAMRS